MAKRISSQPQTSTARMRNRTVKGAYSTSVPADWVEKLVVYETGLSYCIVYSCPGSTSDPL